MFPLHVGAHRNSAWLFGILLGWAAVVAPINAAAQDQPTDAAEPAVETAPEAAAGAAEGENDGLDSAASAAEGENDDPDSATKAAVDTATTDTDKTPTGDKAKGDAAAGDSATAGDQDVASERDADNPFAVDIGSAPEGADAAVLLAQARRLQRLGKHHDAVPLLRTALLVEPENIPAREAFRRSALALKHPEVAADECAALATLYTHAYNRGMAHERYQDLLALDAEHPQVPELQELLGLIDKKIDEPTTIGDRLRSFLGIGVFLVILFFLSNNRRRISKRVVFWGLGLQLFFGAFILKTPVGTALFQGAQNVVKAVLSYTDGAQKFLFGPIYGTMGASSGPAQYVDGVSGDLVSFGVTFVFHILPTIVFFGALMSVLYHLGLVQTLVRGIAWLMRKVMGTSGAESLSAAGNIFVGQTEAPLLIRPYVGNMTMSELMAVMCGGFATVAGGVLAAYVRFGINAGHLLAASVMSAPAALVAAKILYPETKKAETRDGQHRKIERTTTNVVDAAAAGATDGMKLAINVGAMLLAFMALIALIDGILGFASGLLGDGGLTLGHIFGAIFTPIAWCMGVSTPDLSAFGNLLGTKIAINEFVAYVQLGALQNQISERSFTIATYALCGFANFSSIGIQIGGISGIAPERRSDLARIGIKAMIGGAFASWMTACVAGIFL